jgi:hypothetical protein
MHHGQAFDVRPAQSSYSQRRTQIYLAYDVTLPFVTSRTISVSTTAPNTATRIV